MKTYEQLRKEYRIVSNGTFYRVQKLKRGLFLFWKHRWHDLLSGFITPEGNYEIEEFKNLADAQDEIDDLITDELRSNTQWKVVE